MVYGSLGSSCNPRALNAVMKDVDIDGGSVGRSRLSQVRGLLGYLLCAFLTHAESSRIVQFLRETYSTSEVPVLSFFLQYSQQATQTPSYILGSLLAQLIRQTERVPSPLYEQYETGLVPSQLPLDGLLSIVRSLITSFERVFILFDALDEYVKDSNGFLADFQPLFDLPMTSIFVTSRPTFVNKTVLGQFDELKLRAHENDMHVFVLERLKKSPYVGMRGHDRSLEQIAAAIAEKSNDMFLMAMLLINEVLDLSRWKSVEELLFGTSESPTLEALYDSKMHRLESSSTRMSRFALEALSWLGFSREPLTKSQLVEALAIQVGSDDLQKDDSPLFEPMIQACAGLISIEPVEKQVSLIHYTFHTYLRTYLTKMTRLLPENQEPETFIAKKCLTYLRFRPFSLNAPSDLADLNDRLEKYPMLRYAARYWGEHAQSVPIEHVLDDVMLFSGLGNNIAAAGLIMSIYEQYHDHYEQAYRGMLGLHICAYFGLTDIVKHLVETQRIDPNTGTVGAWTALHWASRQGQLSTAINLIRLGASLNATTKLDGWNALHLAAKEGHLDIVASLIDVKCDLNTRDAQKRTALYLSTWAGRSDVAKQLLDSGADPSLPNAHGATPLHCAAKRGRASIVSYLIDAGADVNAEDDVGLTALDEAMRKHNDIIIQVLVDAGAFYKERTDQSSTSHMVDALDWDSYVVNDHETDRIENGSQCICHVLERDPGEEDIGSTLKVFRKTYTLTKDIDGLMSKYFHSERRILERLRHPNVVAYLDFDEDPDQNAFILYTEFCDLGDIRNRYGPSRNDDGDDDDSHYGFWPDTATALQNEECWKLISQLASALAYLHYGLRLTASEGSWGSSFERSWIKVLHRDIKPANVVMQSSESGCTFKLCDLGIASEVKRGAGGTKLIGTPGFKPPEVMANQVWTTKGDIWALGETIRQTNKVKHATCEESVRDLIDKCGNRRTKSRPSSLDILEMSYTVLEENNMLAELPTSSRLQLEAIHTLLGGAKGGYSLKAFNLVADLLDDILPFEDKKTQEHRKATIQRLGHLWEDGAEARSVKYPSEFSLHTLILLDLPNPPKMKLFETVLRKHSDVNKQWSRSRWTPLHLAAQAGNIEICRRLIELDANQARLDLHGHNPAFYVDAGNVELLSLFKANTEKRDAQGEYAQRLPKAVSDDEAALGSKLRDLGI